ncbi:MAG: X-Pro dipeptidyl-peptidase domain protein [Gemmatimonadales bacterium]|nr:X-Pro dipeptidyl-peptidase domain protein [Gemmatimonadales bacterium]
MRPVSATGLASEGPPSGYPFGPDTYQYSGPFIGAPAPPLVCQAGVSGAATYDGFLVSDVDQTSLDARLEIPAGSGPFPLVTLIHGYAGSKTGSGDISSKLLADGYAVLRYSTRGFGDSWGQVNLADLNLEIADMRSMIGRVMDDPNCNLDPNKVAVTGASYGGGHSWLALVEPTFPTPSGAKTVHIVAVAPIAPWTDLFYSLLPNGRPNESINGFGGLKLSYVNGLYASGLRKNPARTYPNYPEYFIAWHAYLNTTEPNSLDPIWLQIRDGVAGYRSIYWQREFWDNTVHNRIPVFQVQGFTDDLFPLPEAKRMLLAINTVEPGYPITSYFGDIGHPRASNKPDEVDYVLSLIRPWLAAYLKGGTPPTPKIYAARTKPRSEPFSSSDVLTVESWDQLWTSTVTKEWRDGPRPLVNPVTFAQSGITWDPFVMEAAEQLKPYLQTPPAPDFVPSSYASYKVKAKQLSGGGDLTISGQPTVSLEAVVVGHRVQLDVRLIDEGGPTDYLITRGTYTIDAGVGADIGRRTIVIPTYGNYWTVPANHKIRLEISNVDSPYITPSREPSTTIVSNVRLELPIR